MHLLVTFRCRFVPQSPFWLLSCNKPKEARSVLSYIAEKNGKPPLDNNFVIQSDEKINNSGSINDHKGYHIKLLVGRTFFLSVIW